jgi:hypothetical protein
MRAHHFFLSTILLLSALTTPAVAQQPAYTKAGALTCRTSASVGLDVGIAGGVLGWAVLTRGRGVPRRALAGTYVGRAATSRSASVPARMFSSAVRNGRWRFSRYRSKDRSASISRWELRVSSFNRKVDHPTHA